MYRLLLRILEVISFIRVPSIRFRKRVTVGKPDAADSLSGEDWKRFLRCEEFAYVWGPHPESPWMPFHCITLFAAIESIDKELIGPMPKDYYPESVLRAPVPSWLTLQDFVILDLSGVQSVSLASWLVSQGRFQPVCTFDNWPDPAGLLKCEKTLAALLRYAAQIERKRTRMSPNDPPLWVCERERLGVAPGRPRQFDNRYYLDDSVLPGPSILKSAGIRRIIYVVPNISDPEERDLSAYFNRMHRDGFQLLKSAFDGSTITEPQVFSPRTNLISPSGFFRSSAGGFGSPIPEPSSGGG